MGLRDPMIDVNIKYLLQQNYTVKKILLELAQDYKKVLETPWINQILIEIQIMRQIIKIVARFASLFKQSIIEIYRNKTQIRKFVGFILITY